MVREMPPPIIPYLSEESNRLPEKPVIRGLTLPVIDIPNPTLNYPVIDVPTQEEFDAAVKAEQKKKEEEFPILLFLSLLVAICAAPVALTLFS